MRNLLAALLFSTATLACTKTPDATPPAPAADPAPAAAAPEPSAPSPSAAAVAPEPAPDFVEAVPGVQVVADYDTPVFYNSGLYWRYNSGWYSSKVYTGGWQREAAPPSVIVSIDRPERFVHYRPSGYVVRSRPAPQREWNPAPVHAEVRVEPPRAEVRVEPPHAVVRVEPRVEIRPAPVVVKVVAPKVIVR